MKMRDVLVDTNRLAKLAAETTGAEYQERRRIIKDLISLWELWETGRHSSGHAEPIFYFFYFLITDPAIVQNESASASEIPLTILPTLATTSSGPNEPTSTAEILEKEPAGNSC
jgi:hypothetical protein